MINLNDLTQEDKEIKIFNNGTAGRVKNVSVSVAKKTPQDKEKAPDFKIKYTDESGAFVDDAVYYPKDSDTDKQKEIALSRLVNVLHAINPDSKQTMLPEFNEYVPAVDFLIKQIISASSMSKVNVFVAFGTKNTPKQYLTVRKFNFIEPFNTENNITRLRVKVSPDPEKSGWDDLMERITPTSFDQITTEEDTSGSDGALDW